MARQKKTEIRLKKTEQVRDREKATGFGDKSVYAPISQYSPSQLRTLMLATIWAEACVDTIADEVVKYKLSSDDPEINAFLEYPSELDPLMLIRKMCIKDMLRWGNGGIVIEYKKKKPFSLNVVPGYTIRLTSDEPPKYQFTELDSNSLKKDKNGNEIILDGKEFMHFCLSKDSDSTLGSSPLNRAYDSVTVEKEIAKKLSSFIKRGFHKSSFISFKKGVSVSGKDLKEFVEYLNALISEGAKILGINKDAELKELPEMSTNEIIELDRWMGLKIASVYKVPPFMLNLVQDVGSLNAREQKARFLENVVLPILEYEVFVYNNILVRKGYEDLEKKIITPALGTKLNYDKARIANLLVGTGEGILTVDEARKMFFNLGEKDLTKEE